MKQTIILFLTILFPFLLKAQDTWTTYNTTNSGLADNNVKSTVIDAAGNKWIGTFEGGVSKFDGTTWTTYNTANSGLASNMVNSIAIDAGGNKWFATQGGGVSKFDGTSWTTYTTADGLVNNTVFAVAIDAAGNKWFGTVAGISKFDGTAWTTYNTTNSALPGNNIRAIAVDAADNKWFGIYNLTGGGSGVSRFDGTTWTSYSTTNGLADNTVNSIAIDAVGNKWFGTSGGVSKFDGTAWTNYTTTNSGLASGFVYSIAIDAAGDKWFGTWGAGVSKFDGTVWTTYNTTNSGLAYNNIYSIAIDAAGNKWIGTYGSGVSMLVAGINHTNAFVTVWDTDKLPNGYYVSFNTTGSNYEYYWEKVGDEANTNSGTYIVNINTQSLVLPSMAAGTGVYKLYIKPENGTFTGFQTYGHAGQAKALTAVESWGNIAWTNLMGMFLAATNLTSLPLDAPDLSQVTNLSLMFAGAESFNQDISGWDVSNVSNMSSMFSGANTFNQDLSNWALKSDVNLSGMLNNSGLSAVNYGLTLKGWAENSNTPNDRTLGAVGLTYLTSAQQYRDILTNNKNWTIDDSGVLPVKVLSFVATLGSNEVKLKWQTVSEQNNKAFVLSRSADGKDFAELTRIAGAGNSSAPKNYNYTDRNPLSGANYYKLEQVDGDGKVNLVGVEVVNFRLLASAVTVYPNPTISEINLTIPEGFGKTVKASILDVLGKTIHTEKIQLIQGQMSYKLANKQLVKGQYVIRIAGEKNTNVLKILVK